MTSFVFQYNGLGIEPLKAQLHELESAISDQLDLIAAVKNSIFHNDVKITNMLSSVTKSWVQPDSLLCSLIRWFPNITHFYITSGCVYTQYTGFELSWKLFEFWIFAAAADPIFWNEWNLIQLQDRSKIFIASLNCFLCVMHCIVLLIKCT